jgi:HPt (histidine-containing phosphotransfer) domain-containing protein
MADGGREAGLLDLFVTTSRGRLTELAGAVDAGDAALAARIAHSLKGSCATFGATMMASAAARLSAADGQELMSAAPTLQRELRSALALTESALRSPDFSSVWLGGSKAP